MSSRGLLIYDSQHEVVAARCSEARLGNVLGAVPMQYNARNFVAVRTTPVLNTHQLVVVSLCFEFCAI